MELKIAAMVLKELGHTTRLDIYKTLVKAGRQGLPVGNCSNISPFRPRP
ncbi:hypothetical protein BANRA_05533 [Klebsiella pneumoniae]|uniref:Transcriptional regulator n=1 Tax=Klebsiella pneumoniae TaxID=573 RepID=A0A7M1HYE8_KLEPN|nr:hypothetical protein NCNNKFFI_05319 [Klebsiella pneumoniae]VCY00713.1 hypothetical protein BANRA_05533 [Klebsiella pneumoniae]